MSSNNQFTPEKYIACVPDDECYIALIHEYSHENCDVRVQFIKRDFVKKLLPRNIKFE